MSNAERIRQMSDTELTVFLNEWAKKHYEWQCDHDETYFWLIDTMSAIYPEQPRLRRPLYPISWD